MSDTQGQPMDRKQFELRGNARAKQDQTNDFSAVDEKDLGPQESYFGGKANYLDALQGPDFNCDSEDFDDDDDVADEIMSNLTHRVHIPRRKSLAPLLRREKILAEVLDQEPDHDAYIESRRKMLEGIKATLAVFQKEAERSRKHVENRDADRAEDHGHGAESSTPSRELPAHSDSSSDTTPPRKPLLEHAQDPMRLHLAEYADPSRPTGAALEYEIAHKKQLAAATSNPEEHERMMEINKMLPEYSKYIRKYVEKKQDYERQLQEQKEMYEKQLQHQKEEYEQQIDDLRKVVDERSSVAEGTGSKLAEE